MIDDVYFYVSDIGRLMRKHFDAAAKDIGVTAPQWRVLLNVQRTPGINQQQLAERLEVEPITTCRMVDRLEQTGLLERRRDPADRRAWRLYITDAALPLADRLCGIAQMKLAEAVAGVSKSEKARLTELLEKLSANCRMSLP
jgi:DNA-binding MarR family transcriptional regulator